MEHNKNSEGDSHAISKMFANKKDSIGEDVVTLTCGRKLAYSEHGVKDGEPVIFFAGAGFGRKHVPTPFTDLLEQKGVRLITIDRPGYGSSDLHNGRNYVDWVGDVKQMMDHIELEKARFVAHSAGTPHLAAVCKFAPERVIAASLVCPVSPIVGTEAVDRPPEPFPRRVARFCLLNCGGFMDTIFGYQFAKWQANPEAFARDTMKMIVAKKDVNFMVNHPEFFEAQCAADFGDAVKAPNGVPALLDDMFHVNWVSWNFRYSDLDLTKSGVPIQVWWGSADDVAPHGGWICNQLGIEGRCVNDAGHGLIHSEFGAILDDLLQRS